ncbi:RHS repeat domain-containing protein [Roseateles amylovorans]|uniref:RHS repeat protein n=1 Tax=Roseateles amylovorans TaxID=2978473 RepID=A0ABY6AZE3_9BURK|nr:hypothetical protein [Roseateles amylovorans]UXH78160.1 hypothetical protein N4261_24945 [Roseateles amylovorans]
MVGSASAYNRGFSKDWDTPAITLAGGTWAGSGPPQVPGFPYLGTGYYFGIDLSGSAYGIPEDAARRGLAFLNSHVSAQGLCTSKYTFSFGEPCSLTVSIDGRNGEFRCKIRGSAWYRGWWLGSGWIGTEDCEGDATGTRSEIVVNSTLLIQKRCNMPGALDTFFDPVSRQCVCRPGQVYIAERKICAPIRDRFILKPCDNCHGNPIMAPIGAKTQSVDVGWQPWLPIRLTFNSIRRVPYEQDVDPFLQSDPQTFGGWTASFDRALFIAPQPNGASLINAARGDGLWTTFTSAPNGFVPANGLVTDRLQASADGYLYKDNQARFIEQYNTRGQLMKVWRADGATLTIDRATAADYPTYLDEGVPKSLTDHFGRVWRMEYGGAEGATRVTAIVDPANGRTAIEYDKDQVSTLVWNDGHSRQFLYEHPLFWPLTGYLDENGVRGGTYTYDAEGRAIGTARAGGLDAYSVTWSAPSRWSIQERYDPQANVLWLDHTLMPAQDARVQLPNGEVEQVSASPLFGSVKWTTKTQAAGAGSAAATARRTLDANQNVTQSDDVNGNRSCMSYDSSRNTETARIDGLTTATECATAWASLPAGARKTSRQWHPDWNLAVNTAEPGLITTLIYNGQPDPTQNNAVLNCMTGATPLPDGSPVAVLCKRVEQATTDANGSLGFAARPQSGVAARSWRWTYNEFGQVLTEVDPRGKTTVTNEYYADTTADHTLGDLKSTSNAVGHVTSFPRYNAYGQPLEVVDPNGISSTYAYDARQRVSSVMLGEITTSYAYWPTGLLKQTTQADGSSVSYEYDDAHRLVGISDQLGNRIDYTLDSSGNRTREAVKDPSGALRRTLSRAYDALGRVQNLTGSR